jgi:hypothetical protein
VGYDHALAQICGDIANRCQLGVAGFDAAFEMGGLGDLPGTQYTDAKKFFVFGNHVIPV